MEFSNEDRFEFLFFFNPAVTNPRSSQGKEILQWSSSSLDLSSVFFSFTEDKSVGKDLHFNHILTAPFKILWLCTEEQLYVQKNNSYIIDPLVLF